MPGIHEVPILTNSSILELTQVPEHLVVIGGSYIGLEFAQAFRRFGARVTVIEKGPRITAREDEDVSEALLRYWRTRASPSASTPNASISPGIRTGSRRA